MNNNTEPPLIVFSFKMAQEMIYGFGLFIFLYKIEISKKDPEHKRHCWFFRRNEQTLEAFNLLMKEIKEEKARIEIEKENKDNEC